MNEKTFEALKRIYIEAKYLAYSGGTKIDKKDLKKVEKWIDEANDYSMNELERSKGN